MKPKPLNEFEHRLIAARIDALAAAGRGRNGAPPRGVASGERPRPGSGQLVDPPPQDPRIVELAAGANDLRRATRERRAKRTDAERGIVQRYTTVQRDQIATLSPDNRALTGFVDRSTDSRLAVGFRIKGDFEDQYTPLYRSRSQWGAGWVVVENPSVLTVSVHVNFSDYSCGGWAEWADDTGFAGIGYSIGIWFSENADEATPVDRIWGTHHNLGSDPVFGNTTFWPLLDLATNSRIPSTPIPDLDIRYPTDLWDGVMLMSPGNYVYVTVDWVLFVQAYGDLCWGAVHAGPNGGGDISITVDLEQP
jgi:hypothetical protein